jgi:hypothetical protein
MWLWFIDHLTAIFWTLVIWIFLSIAFCVAWVLTRRAWQIRHPYVWEEDTEWTMDLTELVEN